MIGNRALVEIVDEVHQLSPCIVGTRGDQLLLNAPFLVKAATNNLRRVRNLPNVQKTALTAFRVRFPLSGDEQTAIAAVLSDMDTELTALEARRDKSRALKQGMMQELLTGRTRLL